MRYNLSGWTPRLLMDLAAFIASSSVPSLHIVLTAHFHPIPAVKRLRRAGSERAAVRQSDILAYFLSSFRDSDGFFALAYERNFFKTPVTPCVASYGIPRLAVRKRLQRPCAGHADKGTQKNKRKRFHMLSPAPFPRPALRAVNSVQADFYLLFVLGKDGNGNERAPVGVASIPGPETCTSAYRGIAPQVGGCTSPATCFKCIHLHGFINILCSTT